MGDIKDVLAKLAAVEQAWHGRLFLAPVIGNNIRLRVAGVVCQLALRSDGMPPGFRGWAIFAIASLSEAVWQRPATLREQAAYLRLLPLARFILVREQAGAWQALPAHRGDQRWQIEGLVTVNLTATTGLLPFMVIRARYDGQFFWYDGVDRERDPAVAAYLRQTLAERRQDGLPIAPELLRKRGLTPEERLAYGVVWAEIGAGLESVTTQQLRASLAHAGASLETYSQQGDGYIVTFTVDGHAHRALVRANDHGILAAGICLSGEDAQFDLTSLVSVLREGQARDSLMWEDL